MDSITNSMDIGLSKLWEMVKDRESWRVIARGVQIVRLSDQTATIVYCIKVSFKG